MQAWGSADKTIFNKITVLQNKAIRILSGKQYFQIYGETPGPLPSSEPLYKNLEILKLVSFYTYFGLRMRIIFSRVLDS